MFENVDLKNGKLIIMSLILKKELTLKEQLSKLKEDILQVEYENEIILDLGWYPEFNLNGSFFLKIIKSNNWENPIFNEEIKEIKKLELELIKAVELIVKMQNK